MTRDDETTNRWIDIRYTKWPSQPHYDEDEFEENRLRFGYPDDIVQLARKASGALTTAVTTPLEPFNTHWRVWYERCFDEL